MYRGNSATGKRLGYPRIFWKCVPKDEEALNSWLAANPTHRAEYAKIIEVWDLSREANGPEAAHDDLLATAPATTSATKRLFGFWKIQLTVAAVFGFMIFSAL